MRYEQQPWNRIVARLEVVGAGAGVAGLTPTALIQRVQDSKFWTGAVWQVGVATVSMTAVDATNLPGFYEAAVLTAQLDYALGYDGYRFYVKDTTFALLENGFINQMLSPWSELFAGFTTTGSFGKYIIQALGIAGGFHRITSPTYDVDGRLLTCNLVSYPTSTDATNATNAWATEVITCTYDGSGNLATLKRV